MDVGKRIVDGLMISFETIGNIILPFFEGFVTFLLNIWDFILDVGAIISIGLLFTMLCMMCASLVAR